MDDTEQILVVEVGAEVRASPVQVPTHHEIVQDTIHGVPLAVDHGPLCASGIAFDRRPERTLSFGRRSRSGRRSAARPSREA